jgi:tRNA (cytidine32/guanosine34-2'-O)-methyltransferase
MSSERTRISFLREVSVLRRLSHPNIDAYVTSFSTQAHHCLVLEALAGGELFEFVADERTRKRMLLPSPRVGEGWDGLEDLQGEGFVRRVFGELARGLGWLHSVGVVHRDVKLESEWPMPPKLQVHRLGLRPKRLRHTDILLTTNPFALEPTLTGSIPLALLPSPPQPFIKITDFGLSRFISPSSPLLQTRCGSESFAAPEIIMGRPYDGRDTDSWACGVVLYALITGLLPFDESQRGQGGIQVGSKAEEQERRRRMMRIAKGQYTWPTTQVEAVTGMEHAEGGGIGSQEVRSLVGRLLVRDPRKRLRIGLVWEETWMNGPGGVSPALSDSPGGEAGASVDGAPVPPDVRNGAGGGRWVDGGWLGDEQPDDAALYADVD